MKGAQDLIIGTILERLTGAEAIYIFGSFDTDGEMIGSDADIAVLLPAGESATVGALLLDETRYALEKALGRDVHLLNLRRVPTVLQKEVIMADRRIHCGNLFAADTFEMLVLSFYQKLNEERAEVMAEGLSSGRFYNV